MRFKKTRSGKKIPRKATTKNISPTKAAAKKPAAKGAKKKRVAPGEPVVLTGSQRRYLRGLAHTLHPLIQVGHKGINAGLIQELAEALDAHELVKVRVGRHAPDELAATAETLAKKTGAAVAQLIGHIILLYRPATEAEARKITLPKARKGELARGREKAKTQVDEADEEELDETEDLGDDAEDEDEDGDFDDELDEDEDDGDTEDLGDEGETEDVGGDLDGDDSDADDLYDELDEDDEEDDEAE